MGLGFKLVLSVLAIWRLTHLLAKEDGPWEVLEWLRRIVPGQLFSCFYCLSVWMSIPFVWFIGGSALEKFVTWWALSGAALLLEKFTEGPVDIKIEAEQAESSDELLRAKHRAAGH